MTRSDARKYALKAVFAFESNKERDVGELWADVCTSLEEDPSEFAHDLFFGTAEHVAEFDAQIAASADNWKFERISKVALAVLRMALFEITYMPDIGLKISINEALELSREFGDEKTVAFVNGVLGRIVNK